MAFSFGFSGDDIDIDDSEINNDISVPSQQATSNSLPELIKAKKHDMHEWLAILPSQIFYNKLPISDTLTIARREIFDIRTQLMAEDSAGHDNEQLISGIEKGDITPNFYEGGFKTWECALDLAKLSLDEEILNEAPESPVDIHIIELGAGTAVPSLTLFARLLSQARPGQSQRKTFFTFADYNSDVLRLVTLPNLLLTWHNARSQTTVSANSSAPDQEEELDITPELVQDFINDLAQCGIFVEFISGAWSPEFVDLVFSSSDSARKVLVLASETIYSPASLMAFSETLLALLRRSNTASARSRALIAAKKVYFGVGGGVDEFLGVLGQLCVNELDVQQKMNVQSEGVGRVVLEVVPSTGP
ncbi:uncharacterized protein N7515_009931 [Penicillium bovifimosum]|uniref:protein-histidine N-methyltransferase n=1 Tax=Penicillium bovifimosum TaxID=126998 RepID=A0A9W9GHE1_9EURO|nr:uncharacterized protein N7515_009931 [Penicillium bovifimosum]KAJ5120543.1 hypothetical protein N7515_009931 [Penicillium bovifimosum]